MSKKLDTSWFDLKNYDKLSELDLFGWLLHLLDRSQLLRMAETGLTPEELAVYKEDRKNPVNLSQNGKNLGKNNSLEEVPFDTYSVQGTKAINLWAACNTPYLGLDDVWMSCSKKGAWTTEEFKLIKKPFDWLVHERNSSRENNLAYVTVNLLATDEQIMSDFEHWLKEYRKFIGFESDKKNFTEKDISGWIEYQVLPYIDLMLAEKIEKKKITQAKIARLIFPDEHNVDLTERLRRTTIPKAKMFLSSERAIFTQAFVAQKNQQSTPTRKT